jgi:uncharacterized protein
MNFLSRASGYIAVPLFALVLAISGAVGSPDEMNADAVVALVNAVPEGQYVTRKLTMELTDRRGKTRSRETLNYRKYFGDEKRTVIFFLAPANVRDTAFLSWDYADPEQDDDQWLYLPALRKVRRVSAADRGDYFMGTDFTYEDIKLDGKLSAADYDYRTLQDAGQDTGAIKLEALPRTPEIVEELGYSKTVATMDPANGMVMEVEFWDTKGRPLKHLVASDISQVDGIWTRHRLDMENLQTGHRTRLIFSEVDYTSPIEDNAFSRQALSRGH